MVTVSPTVTVDVTQISFVVYGTLTLSANYGGGATHGDTMSFLGGQGIPSSTPPTFVEILEAPPAGTSATGYTFNFSPGTTLANGVLQVFSAGAEYTQGSAYSAPLLAATLIYRAIFRSV